MKGSPKNTFVSTGSGVTSGSSPFLLDEHANTLKLMAAVINNIILIHVYLIRYLFQNDLIICLVPWHNNQSRFICPIIIHAPILPPSKLEADVATTVSLSRTVIAFHFASRSNET